MMRPRLEANQQAGIWGYTGCGTVSNRDVDERLSRDFGFGFGFGFVGDKERVCVWEGAGR